MTDYDEDIVEPLLDAAKEAREYAIPHISEYAVGAAVRLDDGTVASGMNVENDNFSGTLHAEEVAYGKAMRERPDADDVPEITHVAVVTTGDDLPEPCGSCKQVLTQHAADDMVMVLANGDESAVEPFPHQFRL